MSCELDSVWDVVGPFPIHAREQHFLSPAYPIDLSVPIDTTKRYPTSLTHTAYASWSQTTADAHGTIRVSHPSVPWDQMRATEGWAGLQHLNVLRGWLYLNTPPDAQPLLHTELLQGALFTILPPPDSPQRKTHVPEWHYGNIYALERSPVQLVSLPVTGNKFEVIICAPYEIRLFGDPSAYSSPHPILTINFSVSLHSPPPDPLTQLVPHSITPHIVDGIPFGDAIGIAIQSLDSESRYWSVVHAHLGSSEHLPPSLSIALLDAAPVRIAPSQTRIVPLRLWHSSEPIPERVEQLDIHLTCVPLSTDPTPSDARKHPTFVLRATVPLSHVPLWTQEKHVPIQSTYFFAKSMPTMFVVKPPREPVANPQGRGNQPILALHGAGVDIRTHSFWPDALPRQKYAWVVMPQGRTAWGLDWHGPSAHEAFTAVSALSRILSERWAPWGFNPDTRVILVGHSNGGQGAWYMASRWPDRVSAVIPVAGYIKSQAYVSWSMSRFAHFIDPALRAVLDSSLTPDDNDLFLGNLVGKPVLAMNGGADDNVPPWQTREQVGIMKTWDPDADVTYHEEPGRPHWYDDVLNNERVQAFLDRVYLASSSPQAERKTISFTLTVAAPVESGPLNGWQIRGLTTPGLLGRLRVTTTPDGHVSVRTTNVSVFSLDARAWPIAHTTTLAIDDDTLPVAPGALLFALNDAHWTAADPSTAPSYGPPRRLQSVLATPAPLTLLVPSLAPSSPEQRAALRIAHALLLFHALDAQIASVAEGAEVHGNLVVVGCADDARARRWLRPGGLWRYDDGDDGGWHVRGVRLDRPSSAILFTQPHPYDDQGVVLYVQSTDASGLERAVRLFPIRTGVLAPDWLVVDGRADAIGAAGVQGAGVYGRTPRGQDWSWNERMSWLD